MKQFIKRSWPRVWGGPDLDDFEKYTVDCGSTRIEFFVPASFFGLPNPSLLHRRLDLGTDGASVQLKTVSWSYQGPWWRCGDDPYVVVASSWQIEQVRGNVCLEPGDLDKLQHYLQQSYEDLFQEKSVTAINEALKVPNDYEQVGIGRVNWLRFMWNPLGDGRPDSVFFCLPLYTRHILTVGFNFIRMVPGCDQYWQAAALEDIGRLMSGTRIYGA